MATVTATKSYSDNYYCNWRRLKINTAMYPSLHNITVLCMHREIERPRERKKRKREREGGREGWREGGRESPGCFGRDRLEVGSWT